MEEGREGQKGKGVCGRWWGVAGGGDPGQGELKTEAGFAEGGAPASPRSLQLL